MYIKSLANLLLTYIILFSFLMLIQSIDHPLFLWEELTFHFETFDLRGVAKGVIFLGTYLLAVLSVMLLISVRSVKLFLGILLIIFIFLSIDFFVQLLGVTHGFSLAEYALSMKEMHNYTYLALYINTIFKAMGLAFLASMVLLGIRKKISTLKIKTKYLLLILFPLGIIYGGCYKIDTFKLSSYPATIKVPLIALDYLRDRVPMQARVLSEDIQPKQRGTFKNIVWIIDESVTGTYLSINGYPKDTTPYLKHLDQKSSKLSNFSVVNSVSNCSAESNLFLRIGANPDKTTDLTHQYYVLPTIFQYAKRAGYTTWLFDSQTKKDYLQDYLTLYDKADIDHFETLGPEVTRTKRDKLVLDTLSKIVNNPKKNDMNFIVLVKYGAHFPYLLTYDHTVSPFQPVLDVSYGGMDMEHKEEQINTYLNAIYSNVDLYLKKMVSQLDLSKSIVFYTSDHGQNILEDKSLTRTHCNTERIVKNEVSVPLMIFQDHAKELFPANKNLFYSQIQLFPTTLSLLGYDKALVEQYGKTLSEGYKNSDERRYILYSTFEFKPYK